MFLALLFNPETGELRRETNENEALSLVLSGWQNISQEVFERLAEAERLLGSLLRLVETQTPFAFSEETEQARAFLEGER